VDAPSPKFIFAAAVAQLGLVLRESAYIEDNDISSLDDRVENAFADPTSPAVAELLAMIEKAAALL
jgi:hypothetical protein